MPQSPVSTSRANWTQELTDVFLSALVDECRGGNRPHKTLNRIGKANVVQRMRHHTGCGWTWDTCKHKWDELRRKWSCWKQLTKSSDVKFHPRTGLIDMPDDWWDAQIAANKHAKVFRQCRLENEEQLDYIFAKMEPANASVLSSGCGASGFHEQGSLESDALRFLNWKALPRPIHCPRLSSPPQPLKRARTNACANEVGGHDGGRAEAPTPDMESDPEYEAFMRELLDGGVDPESDEYFMASEVLLDIPRRGAYRPLPTVKAKIAWIKRAYRSMIGQPLSL
ncbi:hypothetical protein BS78_08G038300 [Paspalum vaginatum]|nr:hypothetical protein BS78_08G038300 [Paspalum vaginatum]